MKKSTGTRWFLGPRNVAANESVMEALAQTCEASPEKIYLGKRDIEGEGRDVVEVSKSMLSRIQDSVPLFHEKYCVYKQTPQAAAMSLVSDRK